MFMHYIHIINFQLGRLGYYLLQAKFFIKQGFGSSLFFGTIIGTYYNNILRFYSR
jgi:hypothetical protein